MTTSRTRVALLGYGTVGSALHQLLREQRDHILLATQCDVDVCSVLVRDASAPRPGIEVDDGMLTSSIEDVLAAAPDVVCEAMGGIEPTRTYLLQLLDRGIPVVTANKQLIARHGTELFARAEAAGTQLRFEASVCGAVPIVRMLRESLAASRVDELLGILNGTTNYILSAMTAQGASYEAALADATKLGYAEPDPTEDVEGIDAAAKLAILAGIAFGTTVDVTAIPRAGITAVSAADISHAAALGCRIKLIGRARRSGDSGCVMVDVGPMLVPTQHPLASIEGSTNAVLLDGEPFRRLVVQGPGAGGPETASALAGDLVSVLGSKPSFLTRDPHVANLMIAPRDQRVQQHYVRMRVADQPGVLAAVASALARTGVSIERVSQQLDEPGAATLVLTTHPCTTSAVLSALAGAEDHDRTILPMLDERRSA